MSDYRCAYCGRDLDAIGEHPETVFEIVDEPTDE